MYDRFILQLTTMLPNMKTKLLNGKTVEIKRIEKTCI